MRRRLMIIATLLAVLMVMASGSWWVWRTWYAADQIHAAVEAYDEERVSLLIKLGAPVEAAIPLLRFTDKRTRGKLLHWMAMSEAHPITNLLLEGGANVDARDANGNTPLYWTVIFSNPEAAKLLLDYGADPKVKDNQGRTPLEQAILEKETEIVDLLKAHMAKQKTPAPAKAP